VAWKRWINSINHNRTSNSFRNNINSLRYSELIGKQPILSQILVEKTDPAAQKSAEPRIPGPEKGIRIWGTDQTDHDKIMDCGDYLIYHDEWFPTHFVSLPYFTSLSLAQLPGSSVAINMLSIKSHALNRGPIFSGYIVIYIYMLYI